MFVNTNCSTNVRLDLQDDRYRGDAYGGTDLTLADQSAGNLGYIGGAGDHAATGSEASDATCGRGCWCGYSMNTSLLGNDHDPTIDEPYKACDCYHTLPWWYGDLGSKLTGEPPILLPITKTNLSLLRFYGIIPCNASLEDPGLTYTGNFASFGAAASTNFYQEYAWTLIEDGDSSTLMNPYECFGDLSTIYDIMKNYTSAQVPRLNTSDFEISTQDECSPSFTLNVDQGA